MGRRSASKRHYRTLSTAEPLRQTAPQRPNSPTDEQLAFGITNFTFHHMTTDKLTRRRINLIDKKTGPTVYIQTQADATTQ